MRGSWNHISLFMYESLRNGEDLFRKNRNVLVKEMVAPLHWHSSYTQNGNRVRTVLPQLDARGISVIRELIDGGHLPAQTEGRIMSSGNCDLQGLH